MADVIPPTIAGEPLQSRTTTMPAGADPANASGTATSPNFVAFVELFYFAYRGFTRDPDDILAQYGFGRAHHRVLHFVHRNPGLKVAELLDILKITKQSLARVLKQLVDEGFVIQRAGYADRRERRLYVSAKGSRLTDKLTTIQVKRFETALAETGIGGEALTRLFLFGMIDTADRAAVEALIHNGGTTSRDGSGPR